MVGSQRENKVISRKKKHIPQHAVLKALLAVAHVAHVDHVRTCVCLMSDEISAVS